MQSGPEFKLIIILPSTHVENTVISKYSYESIIRRLTRLQK